MNHLTGINIRKGLELDILPEDIFSLKEQSTGDIRVKHFFENQKAKKNQDQGFLKTAKNNEVHEYKEFVSTHKINSTLNVNVYNEYHLIYNRFKKENFSCSLIQDLYFYNINTLCFEDFCLNLMSPQAFTGCFKQQNLQYIFAGHGEFDISYAASIFPLAIAGNLTLSHFFIYYKGILTSIDNIISGEVEIDLHEQKEYFNEKEFLLIRNELTKQKQDIREMIRNNP